MRPVHRIFLSLVVISLVVCLALASSGSPVTEDPYRRPEAAAEITRVRDLLFDGQYEETIAACKIARQKFPDLLVWHFAAMLAPQARMLEMHDWDLSNEYLAEWEELLKLSLEIKKKRPYSAYDYLCLGGGYGVVGLHYARGRKYRQAFDVGVKALRVLSKALEVDPECNDAYLGYGIYHYYRGVLAERIKWLPLFSNDRRVGLEELDRARKGLYARPLADLAQVYLYKDEGKWNEGLEIAQKLRKEYPHGLLLPQLIGYFQLNLGQHEAALANANLVLKSDPQNGPVHLLRGMCLFNLNPVFGGIEEAEREFKDCINLGATSEYRAAAFYFIGEIAWKRGRYEEARASWRKAADLDPEFKEPRKALQRHTPPGSHQ